MSLFERYRQFEDRLTQLVKDCDHEYYVITGCSRSGTTYAGKVYQAAGLQIGHHVNPGKDGVVSDIALTFDCLKECRVFHQVRHPLNQIASMTTSMKETWEYLESILPIKGLPLLQKCMIYWHDWNVMAYEKASYCYRVETMEHLWPSICELTGLQAPFPDIDKTTNSREHKPIEWADLERQDLALATKIINLATYYGYYKELGKNGNVESN